MNEQSREALREELSPNAPPPAPPPPEAPKLAVSAPVIRTLTHHDTCPGIRGRECSCAANLELVRSGGYTALEVKSVEWKEQTRIKNNDGIVRSGLKTVKADLWRVDDGIEVQRTRPAPSGSKTAPPITVTEQLPARWVCTRCGWAGRGTNISHVCDLASVALATRVQTLAEGLTDEEKRSGELRIVIWKDPEDIFHIAEELVKDGRVVKTVERDRDGAYGVVEGALLSAVVDLWS